VPAVVLVVLGGDAGGGLLTEAAALRSQVGQPGVAQLVEGVPGAVRVVELGGLVEQVLGGRVGALMD